MKKHYSRRKFLKQSSAIVLSSTLLPVFPASLSEKVNQNTVNHSRIERIVSEIILQGRRNNQAWFEPAVGVIPGNKNKPSQVFVRTTLLTGNDIGPQLYL